MTRRMTRGPDDFDFAVLDGQALGALQQGVGLDHGDELSGRHGRGLDELGLLLRDAVTAQPLRHVVDEVFGPLTVANRAVDEVQ